MKQVGIAIGIVILIMLGITTDRLVNTTLDKNNSSSVEHQQAVVKEGRRIAKKLAAKTTKLNRQVESVEFFGNDSGSGTIEITYKGVYSSDGMSYGETERLVEELAEKILELNKMHLEDFSPTPGMPKPTDFGLKVTMVVIDANIDNVSYIGMAEEEPK